MAVARVVALAMTLGQGCAVAGPAAAPPSPEDSVAAKAHLDAIVRDHWDYVHQEWPAIGAWAGIRPAQLPDVSWEAAKAHGHFARAAMRALDDVHYEALSENDYLTYSALEWDMKMLSRLSGYFWTDLGDLAPQRSPLVGTVGLLAGHPLATQADVERYLYLVQAVPPLVDSVRSGLVQRRERGVVLARALLPRAVGFVRSLMKPPAESPFAPVASRRAALDSAVSARFIAELAEAIEQRVNPALARLVGDLEGEYRAAAPALLGLGQYPGGLPHYQALLEFESTLDITPEEAHAVGLEEVLRFDTLVAQARVAAGAPADRDSLLAWLVGALRGSPHAATAGAAAETVPARITAQLDSAPQKLIPAIAAPPLSVVVIDTMTTGEAEWGPMARYIPPSVGMPAAVYRVNLRQVRDGTWYPVTARVMHDLMPGQHLQAARQRENAALPAFRRAADYGGYVAGWRAYVLELSDSLAALSPAEKLSVRLLGLRAACGLVVDTGINYFGWGREKALDFLRRHLPDDDAMLERDFVLSAAEAPASLTPAALGARELRALRRWAEQELESRFDLRAFHETVLSAGALPLPVLGAHLESWIYEQQAAGEDRKVRGPRP